MKAPGKVSAERIELLSRNQRRLVMLGSRLFRTGWRSRPKRY